MDNRQKRSQTKIENIKRAASQLFTTRGVDAVSMDDIANEANVSKMTIYKHFGSKDDLYAAVITMFIDETLAATEAVINSDMDFFDKLKFVIFRKTTTTPLVSWSYLMQLWKQGGQPATILTDTLQSKVKGLIYQVYAEGKSKGFIDENVPDDLLYLYAEIFRAGLNAKAIDVEAALVDKDALEKLVNLYFFGLIKR